MNTEENNQETGVESTNDTGEGESQVETIAIPKSDYDKLLLDHGSIKRELKDLKKSKEEPKETSKTNQKLDESNLLQRVEKLALNTAGVTHPDDVELARTTAKKWNMDLEDVLSDDDFKVKLEKLQTGRANVQATSNVRGGTGSNQGKGTAEHWIAKGVYPTREEVPDRATRTKIRQAMIKNSGTNGKTFYND